MKKCLMISLIVMMVLFSSLLAMERDANTAYATPGQKELNLTTIRHTTPIKVTGAVLLDTVITSIALPKYALFKAVNIVVADTVESRGDSALFKILCGTTEIFSQYTSAFKLGNSSYPRMFSFTPSALYSTIPPVSGNAFSYRITQAATSGTEGITEGTFYIIVDYTMPFENAVLP